MDKINHKKNLFFDYQSNAKIRFKICNVFVNDTYPHLFGVKTDKLAFTVPKKMAIQTPKYLFIPLSYYQTVLTDFYHKINLASK
jgi:hypothetical protein